ncbi:MAG: YggT family protein [Actinomycetaceae bacterium]|nr:YggT family protein [Actinomycetaceae bacterium]
MSAILVWFGFAMSQLIYIYMLILLARVILDWVDLLVRDFRPKGVVLLVANLIYSLTDPPIKFFGRFIPPLRIGNIALDLGFLALFFSLYFANYLIVVIIRFFVA